MSKYLLAATSLAATWFLPIEYARANSLSLLVWFGLLLENGPRPPSFGTGELVLGLRMARQLSS